MDKTAKVYRLLQERFLAHYHTLQDFKKRTGCKLSAETIRAHIYNARPASAPILMLLAKHLDFTPAQIRQMLIDCGDTDFHQLLAADDASERLSTADRALLAAVHTITEQRPEHLKTIADHLDLIAAACGVRIDEHTVKLRASRKTAHKRRKQKE